MYFIARFLLFSTLVSGFVHHCTSEGVNLKTLKKVQVLYRHGDRSPLKSYPNDPYNDETKYWPKGPGQLTEIGKDQQYDLGQFLRQRYDGFMDKEYDMDEIHVLSSDTDRSLMSAEANLAGFYPKKLVLTKSEGQAQRRSINNKLDIQLVPIHTVPKQSDKMLKMSAPCPRKQEAWSEYLKDSEEYKKILADNREFLDFVGEKAGTPIKTIFSLTSVHDPLFCEQQHGLPLPDWANSTVMERIAELRAIGFKFMYGGTTEIKRLKGGPLAKQMISNMEGDAQELGSSKSYKFHMYSAHDDTVAAVMSTMGVFDPQIPSYASTFIVELHQDEKTGKHFVDLFFRNTSAQSPFELHIPGCGTPCYLEEMSEVIAPFIPDNWEAECYLSFGTHVSAVAPTGSVVSGQAYSAIVAFVGILAAAIIVWLSILLISAKHKQRGMFVEKRPILKDAYAQIA